MANCPVCQSECTESEVKHCSFCGWDLTPYPLTFAGQVPEAFLEKERTKLAWARKMWTRTQSQSQQLHQSQLRIEQLNQQEGQLQPELSQMQSRVSHIKEEERTLREATITHLQNQLSNAQAQLEQANREQSQLRFQLEEANRQIAELTSFLYTERSKWQLPERQSERGVDFRKLEWLLILKNWEEADRETWIILLGISGNDALKKGYLDEQDIENLSIHDLKVINELWKLYSHNRYGFSAQWKVVKSNKKKGISFEKPSEIGYYPAGYILRAIGLNGLGLILRKLESHNVFHDI